MNGILLICFLLSPLAGVQEQQLPRDDMQLRVTVQGVDSKGGNVHIALHGPETFLQATPALGGLILSPQGKKAVSGRFQAIPAGTYAVAVFQDMNGNNRLDKNTLGIPTEPYAFSGNPVVKWSAPTFKDAAIHLNQAEKGISVKLKYWKDY
jgi:uncharacterized protein (DUF2141 family)